MADPFVQAVLNVADKAVERARAVVPGKIEATVRASNGERDVKFLPGIGRRMAGEEVADGPVEPAPVLYPAGGGFSMVWPLDEGDEGLGLAADRASDTWTANREVGRAPVFERSHDVSDVRILPVAQTPAGAPDDPGADWVISGPEGEAMRVGGDGQVTIRQGGLQVATITMSGGSVIIEAAPGGTVEAGGALALVIANQLQSFLADAFASAPVGIQDGGQVFKTWMAAKMAGLPPATPPSLSAATQTEITKGS